MSNYWVYIQKKKTYRLNTNIVGLYVVNIPNTYVGKGEITIYIFINNYQHHI